jgi:hypothetical protein
MIFRTPPATAFHGLSVLMFFPLFPKEQDMWKTEPGQVKGLSVDLNATVGM